MGAYFLVVNPIKREYLSPSRFGEGIKFASVLRGDYCIQALKLLIADCFEKSETSFRGAWLGDPVILASDDSGQAYPGEPSRNMHAIATAEYTDISYRALAELCHDADIASELVSRARENHTLLLDLATVVEQYDMRQLEVRLEDSVGRPWRKAYGLALAHSPRWSPLPCID